MPRSTRLAFVFVWFLLFLAPGVGSFGQTKSSQSNTGSAPAAPSPLPAGPGRFTFDLGGHPQCATALFGDAAPALVDQLVRRRLEAGLLRETAVTEMRESNTPGAAIGVVHSGKLVLTCGFGVANVETGQPVTADTLFRLGSTTKMFTAALVVSQAHEGKVQLDQPIGRYLPELHERIAALTIHQLLTHTAGLTDESIMSGLHDDSALAQGIRGMDGSWQFAENGRAYKRIASLKPQP